MLPLESTVNRSTQNGQMMRLLFSVSVPISCIVMLLNSSPRPITPFDPIFKEMDYNKITKQSVYKSKKKHSCETKRIRLTDDTLDYISVYHVPVLLVIYIYDVTGYAAVPNVMIKISNNNQICCKNKRILYFK